MHQHDKLILGAQSLGYSNVEDGMCMGAAYLLGIFLAGRKEEYVSSLMSLLEKYQGGEISLKEAVENVREKVKQKEHLTPEQLLLLDMAAFYDAIELLQNWSLHLDLFHEASFTHDFQRIYSFITPKTLEELELIIFRNKPFIGVEEEIIGFFNDLLESLKLTTIPISIVISHIEHVVFLQWKNGQWLFIDINYNNDGLHFPVYEQLLDTKKLCEHLYKSFEVEESQYLAFSSLLFGFAPGEKQFRESLATFNKEKYPSSEKIVLQDSAGVSLIYLAAHEGDAEMVNYLIKNGSKIDPIPTLDDITPLAIAVMNGHQEVVRILAEAGANVNIEAESGMCPLHHAIDLNHIGCVEILLRNGANPNLIPEEQAFIPLHKACILHYSAIAELLIYFGADITMMDENNGRAFDLALHYGYYDIAELILNRAIQLQLPPLAFMAINTLPEAKIQFIDTEYQPYLQGKKSLLAPRSQSMFREESQTEEPVAKRQKKSF